MKRTYHPSKPRGNPSARLNIAVLACLFLLIIWGIFLVRNKLLYNAYDMGTRLANSYASEEEDRLAVYELFLDLGSVNISERIEAGADEEFLQRWLARYSAHLSQILGTSVFDPYAVINGQIIAADPWEGDASYNYEESEWYQQALAANGSFIFTDAYTDAVTGKQIITLARELDTDGDVLAFDILLENFHSKKSQSDLPAGSSYYLFDPNGSLLYMFSHLDLSDSDSQVYVKQLFQEVSGGGLDNYASTIRGLDGRNRGVYYAITDNGWYSVITMPVGAILYEQYNSTLVILGVLAFVLVAIVVAITIRTTISDRKARHANDTLQVLGDTYYAIYRINCLSETYESIKSSEDVRPLLGKTGSYRHLMDVLKNCVDQKTYQEFEQSFSVDNIRKLTAQGVHEFGGDYQRSFGGTFKWVSIKIIRNQSLPSDEVIMCFREIDAEKHRDMQRYILLENALNTARQAAKNKNSFFSSVSHDMRTPLNAVIGLADLACREDSIPDKVRDYLEKIRHSGKQLLTLVNDILDMSRIEHGEKTELDYAPMDLYKCVEDCVSMFREQAAQEGKTLEITADGSDYSVMCDQFHLSQVLNNLISNAMKYSMAQAVITVSVARTAVQKNMGKYQIVIKDTGIGMSEEFLEHIFEPFSRETMFAPVSITGTGLGMPIVKSLVQQMSGEIHISSQLGKGTTVTIILPLQMTDTPVGIQEAAASVSEEPSMFLEGRKILVAEDNMINMEIATEYLKMQGAQVLQAWNGQEAVDIFSSLEPQSLDAILMDMQMPQMDGCTASQLIRQMDRPDAGTIPIIAVTANAFAEDIAKTTRAGMDAHISKPLDMRDLMEVLKKYIR